MFKKRILLLPMVFVATLCIRHADSDELWQFDIAVAQEKAIEQNRLLIVVQFDSNFLQPVQGTEELNNYEHHSLDQDTRQWIGNNVVLVAENVGKPPNIGVKFGRAYQQRLAKSAKLIPPMAKRAKSIGTCITWFCSSSGVVYGFQIGYPEPGDFWAEAKSIHASLPNFGASPNQETVGKWHRANVVSQDQVVYRKLLKSSNSNNKKIFRRETIEYSVAAAAKARHNRMRERFGDQWDQRMLANFGAFENQFFRMLLAEAHDADITELQRHVWKYLTGIQMWQADQKAIVNWAEKQRSEKRAVLLRIPEGDLLRWPPPSRPRLQELVNQFSVRENATIDDVAVIAGYFKTEKLLIPVDRTPTFFVATSLGDDYQLMSSEDGDSDLQKKMETVNTLEASRR